MTLFNYDYEPNYLKLIKLNKLSLVYIFNQKMILIIFEEREFNSNATKLKHVHVMSMPPIPIFFLDLVSAKLMRNFFLLNLTL